MGLVIGNFAACPKPLRRSSSSKSMQYPKNIETKIGFHHIRERLRKHCLSTLGLAYVERMSFSHDLTQLGKLLRQADEFRRILEGDDTFPAAAYLDARPWLEKAKVAGSFLQTEEFHQLGRSLDTVLAASRFFLKHGESYPELAAIGALPQVDPTLPKRIQEKIDEQGELRPNASPELAKIRADLQAAQSRLRNTLQRMLKSSIEKGHSPEDISLTIRNGRMVIPIKAEYKRQIRGFIHDESATGQTAFIEPTEVLEINNLVRELEYAERREIIRILTELTDFLRPYIPHLDSAYRFLGMVDFIRAKARLAIELGAVLPTLDKRSVLDWKLARHPVLHFSLREQGKEVVPLTVSLNEQQRILIVSGPNAGGKSVMLKTVALIQYMGQCGMLVPVEENSTLGIFRNIFIDIGDEQSIENDLSTYSSHLRNMKYFLEFVDKKTLFLIDEFGTGTEPQFGGAIAESILQQLHALNGYGIINTHYGNLKEFGDQTPGISNAAMRYDTRQLEPLYELEIGKPGSSFALEIARKIGIPKVVLEQAKNKVGYTQVNMERLLGELESEKTKMEQESRQVSGKRVQLDKMIKNYSELKEYLDTEKKKIIRQAKDEARGLIAEANKKIENTIREIRESEAEKERTKALREALKAEATALEEKPQKAKRQTSRVKVVEGTVQVGDLIRIKGQSAVGEVLELNRKDALIRMGDLKSTVKVNRLERISRKDYEERAGKERKKGMSGYNLNATAANFSSELDLRGKRGEEALGEVDQFIDKALVLGHAELRIIHGKGNGILKDLIRNHLRAYNQIAHLRDEHADFGGAGVTLVTMSS